MRHVKGGPENWTSERGYMRGVIMPFGSGPDSDIQVQLTTIAPGDTVLPHSHLKQAEYIYFLEGTCDYFFGDQTVRVKPGDLLVVEPGEEHGAANNGTETAKFLTFKLHGQPGDTNWRNSQ